MINAFSSDLLSISKRNKWGYIDNTGKVVIKPEFKYAGDFVEGLAPVKFRNNKWGYIDETGKTVIEGKYLSATTFSEGFAIVQTASRGAAYNFIDKTDNLLLENNVGDAKRFSDGLAPVMIASGEWVYINNLGKKVITNGEIGYFKSAGIFNEGIAAVFSEDGNALNNYHYAFIDKTGKEVITLDKSTTMAIGSFSEGLAPVMINRKWGYYNLQGEIVIPAHYALAMPFKNGYAAAIYEPTDDYKGWTIIDKTGKPVFERTFNRITTGYLGVYANTYRDIMNKVDNVARNLNVRLTGGKSAFRSTGIMIIEPGMFGIHDFEFSEGYVPMIVKAIKAKYRGNIPAEVYAEMPKEPTEFYNYVDLKGEKLNNIQWTEAYPFKNGIAKVYTKKDTFGYIDNTGKYIWKPQK